MSDFIEGLEILKGILPPNSLAFAVKILMEAGVRSICFKEDRCAWGMSLLGVPGACDIGEKKIDLDLGMDLNRPQELIRRWHKIEISLREAPLWILLHEVGHVVRGSSQDLAEKFAKEKFLEWRSSTIKIS